ALRRKSQLLAPLLGGIILDTVLRTSPCRAIKSWRRRRRNGGAIVGAGNSRRRIVEGLRGLLVLTRIATVISSARCHVEVFETVIHREGVNLNPVLERFGLVERFVVGHAEARNARAIGNRVISIGAILTA